MRIGLIAVLIFCGTFCSAQVHLVNLSLSNPIEKTIYRKWYNYIQIISADTSLNYEIKANKSWVKKDNEKANLFRIKPWGKGDDTLKIVLNGNIIKNEVFKIEETRNQGPFIVSPEKSRLTISEIMNSPKVNCSKEITIFYDCTITSFTVVGKSNNINKDTIDLNEKPNFVLKNNGYELSPIVLEHIKKLNVGAKLFIEDIHAKGPDDVIRRLPGFIITII